MRKSEVRGGREAQGRMQAGLFQAIVCGELRGVNASKSTSRKEVFVARDITSEGWEGWEGLEES